LLRFGVPLIPHVIGGVLIVQTDRLLLTNMVGLSETGLYTVAYQLVVVIEVLAVSFNSAYAPWLFRQLADPGPQTSRRLVRLTYVQFATMATLSLVVAVAMPWLAGVLLDARYAAASELVAWLSVGLCFSAMYYMVTNYIFFAQKTEWLALISFSVALVNVPVTYFLILANGLVGAAQATAIALGLTFVLTWIASQRVYPMPWLSAVTER
jgi:O-antigen/teichoic acid export membrane protein